MTGFATSFAQHAWAVHRCARVASAAPAPIALIPISPSLRTYLYDPMSPNFRQYLSPQEASDRFGPSQAAYDAVAGHLDQRH